ncbi:MAG: Hsp33 family molecular chaperone HslO [Lachnospiraceae bacterium]|nr:Hsp33 family molecular chaperone HslO [Lachnospiraceae bacterium]
MKDVMIRGMAAGGQVRAFAAYTRGVAEKARASHDLSPVVCAALGRLLTAGALMGWMLKGRGDILTLKVEGDGPVGALTVTADALGRVKGYANHPQAMLPASPAGKLDVGGIVGAGTLSVICDLGLKEPYVGQTALVNGEIAEDLAYYYAASEQTPSCVALGVLMNKNNTVRHAGGFILQLMPEAGEDVVALLEKNVNALPPVTHLLCEGLDVKGILERALEGLDLQITEEGPVRFACSCSRRRVEKALLGISRSDLEELAAEGKPLEVCCHFCGKKYMVDAGELLVPMAGL